MMPSRIALHAALVLYSGRIFASAAAPPALLKSRSPLAVIVVRRNGKYDAAKLRKLMPMLLRNAVIESAQVIGSGLSPDWTSSNATMLALIEPQNVIMFCIAVAFSAGFSRFTSGQTSI